MKVRVKDEICQGHALCVIVCPEVFKSNDADGHAFVARHEVPSGLEDSVLTASRSCPEGAIEIERTTKAGSDLASRGASPCQK